MLLCKCSTMWRTNNDVQRRKGRWKQNKKETLEDWDNTQAAILDLLRDVRHIISAIGAQVSFLEGKIPSETTEDGKQESPLSVAPERDDPTPQQYLRDIGIEFVCVKNCAVIVRKPASWTGCLWFWQTKHTKRGPTRSLSLKMPDCAKRQSNWGSMNLDQRMLRTMYSRYFMHRGCSL